MEAQPPIVVRRATIDDAAFLGRIDQIASTPPFERSLWEDLVEPTGTPTLRFLEAMFLNRASGWGEPEDFLVLEREGAPVAACAVFEPGEDFENHGTLKLEKLPQLASYLGWGESELQGFTERYLESFPPEDADALVPQAAMIIESVGVVPEARGLGLGRRLMDEACAEAKRRGHGSIGVMVIHGNEIARRLYETSGFEPYITFHAAFYKHRFPGVTKYRKPLTAAA